MGGKERRRNGWRSSGRKADEKQPESPTMFFFNCTTPCLIRHFSPIIIFLVCFSFFPPHTSIFTRGKHNGIDAATLFALHESFRSRSHAVIKIVYRRRNGSFSRHRHIYLVPWIYFLLIFLFTLLPFLSHSLPLSLSLPLSSSLIPTLSFRVPMRLCHRNSSPEIAAVLRTRTRQDDDHRVTTTGSLSLYLLHSFFLDFTSTRRGQHS